MNPIVLLDEWIMGRIFDPLSWRIEERFSYNNFDVGRLILPIWPISLLIATLMNVYAYNFPDIVVAIFFAGMSYMQSFRVQRVQKKGFRNLMRVHPIWPHFRIFVMIGLMFGLWVERAGSLEWFNYACFVPFWVHFCFISCNAVPPEFRQRRRVLANALV